MARARGANAVLAGAFETIYGTPPSSGYRKLPFVSSDLGEEQGLIASDLLGYGREPLTPDRDVINNRGNLVVPVDVRNIGNWLKLMMGPPTTTGTTTKTHEFRSGAVSLPSYALEVQHPEVPSYAMSYGVRGDTMRIDMARSGLLNATIGFIAQGEKDPKGTSDAGTVAAGAEVRRFSHFMGQVTRDGDPLGLVVSSSFTYSNGLDPVEVIRGDGRIEDADPGMVAMTGEIRVRFADTILLDQARDGAPCELTFGWEADDDTSLVFTAHAVYLPRSRRPITGPGGIEVTFPWQAARGADGRTVTAVLTNDVTTY